MVVWEVEDEAESRFNTINLDFSRRHAHPQSV